MEGGTWARGSHRLAFVAGNRHVYVATPATYGDVDVPTPPPVPTLCPTPPPSR